MQRYLGFDLADDTVTVEAPVVQGPALNATTDMPVVEAEAAPPAVDTEVNTSTESTATEAEASSDAADTVAEEATGAETGHDDTDNDSGAEKAKEVPPWLKREVTKARNKERAAQERAAAAEAKANETASQLASALEALKNVSGTKKEADTAAATPRPQRENFDSPDAYDSALISWAADNAAKTAEAKILEREAKRQSDLTQKQRDDNAKKARDDRAKDWQSKADKFAKEHPDFADLVTENDDLKISQAMTDFITEADNGPEIAYHLGKNPELADRISQLSPAKAGIELGKIVANLEAAAKPKVSKAPRPASPVSARNTAAKKTAEEESMDEYAARRSPQIQRDRMGPSARLLAQ